MARSRRATPKARLLVRTDKPFKVAEHRRERRALTSVDLTADEPPSPRLFGDERHSDKDGKALFDPAERPDLLRK